MSVAANLMRQLADHLRPRTTPERTTLIAPEDQTDAMCRGDRGAPAMTARMVIQAALHARISATGTVTTTTRRASCWRVPSLT